MHKNPNSKGGLMSKMRMRNRFFISGLALIFWLLPFISQAATSDYPTRPIEVVVHTSPGGVADNLTRLISTKLTETLGVPLLITNKPAGSGAAGIESVVNAKPDGYTVLAAADTAVILLPLMSSEVSFTLKSLLPIAWIAYAPNAVVVRTESPFKTLQELIDFAKKNPGKLTFGSTGASHASRISMELIKKEAGVEIVHVPYQGAGPLRPAILGGHVDLACDSIVGVYPQVKGGNLRALAICADKRFAELPSVPTVAELGYPKASIPVRAGYMVPLGTPQQVIDKWNQAIQKALADPKVESQITKASLTVDYKPLEAMVKSLENLNGILSEWVKESGLIKK